MTIAFGCMNTPYTGFDTASVGQNGNLSFLFNTTAPLTLSPSHLQPVAGPILTLPGFVSEQFCPAPDKTDTAPNPQPVKRTRRKKNIKQSTRPNQPNFVKFQGPRNPNARYEIVKGADGLLYEVEISNSGWRERKPRFSERPPAKSFWGRVGQGCMKFFDAVFDFVTEPFTTLRNWFFGKPSSDKPLSDTDKLINEFGNFALSAPLYFCVPFPVAAGVVGFQCLNRFVNWALS